MAKFNCFSQTLPAKQVLLEERRFDGRFNAIGFLVAPHAVRTGGNVSQNAFHKRLPKKITKDQKSLGRRLSHLPIKPCFSQAKSLVVRKPLCLLRRQTADQPQPGR